jgi:RNA-binding protein
VPKKPVKKKAAPKKKKPSVPLSPLTGKHKSYLRSLAHPLKPVVQIGHQGSTEGVVAALDVALEQHELIKLKVSAECQQSAAEIAPAIEKATRSQVAQIIGRTVVLYRRRDENPKIVLPRPKPKSAARPVAPQIEEEDDDYGADDEDDDPDDADDDEELE